MLFFSFAVVTVGFWLTKCSSSPLLSSLLGSGHPLLCCSNCIEPFCFFFAVRPWTTIKTRCKRWLGTRLKRLCCCLVASTRRFAWFDTPSLLSSSCFCISTVNSHPTLLLFIGCFIGRFPPYMFLLMSQLGHIKLSTTITGNTKYKTGL